MKNQLIRGFVRLAQWLLPKHRATNRLLIVATTALGDTLWATPAIQNIRQRHPDAYLAVLTSPIGMQLLKHNPSIDQLHVLEEPLLPRFFSLWKRLYAEKFDTVLLFHASQRLTLPLCSLLGAEKVVGTAGINKGLDSLLTHPLPLLSQHEIIRRLKIAEQIGAKPYVQTLSLFLQPEEKLPPRSKGPWIAIHPGSKDGFKRWPAANFAEVGRKLKEQMKCEILITGNGAEKALMEEVAAQIPGAHLYESNTSLRAFAALLEQMDLLICNDTGPVHLACALNRPVVALYCSTDPHLCGPHLAPNAIAISKRPTCEPCLKRKCGVPFCFLQIGVDEVVAAANRLMTKDVMRISARREELR
ncbi:MAG TPA: glycosyltransferase family 9 protein [Chlamydiales bacterium]|nr:glycosyltransferase family 9 protein [Chlamydiales bacterium]